MSVSLEQTDSDFDPVCTGNWSSDSEVAILSDAEPLNLSISEMGGELRPPLQSDTEPEERGRMADDEYSSSETDWPMTSSDEEDGKLDWERIMETPSYKMVQEACKIVQKTLNINKN